MLFRVSQFKFAYRVYSVFLSILEREGSKDPGLFLQLLQLLCKMRYFISLVGDGNNLLINNPFSIESALLLPRSLSEFLLFLFLQTFHKALLRSPDLALGESYPS